jgi:5'/3'-nucleotidase SurE
MLLHRIVIFYLAALLMIPIPALATGGGGAAEPLDLNILVVNDDGYDKAGIIALRDALVAAGHDVTVVAPASQQSGKGGSINTGIFDFTPGQGTMQLVLREEGLWSLDGTPVDSLKAGLDIVMAQNPPDLVVSGLNEGQNLGKAGTNTSGTEGAALAATFAGVPAIAGSVGIDIAEQGAGFPSTEAAYEPAADFMARLIDELTRQNGTRILPKRVRMLNVNFPVPYESIEGVRFTRLGDGSDLQIPLFDPSQGFPAFGIPPIPSFPPCASVDTAGEFCFATPGVDFGDGEPNAVSNSDIDAHADGFISITPYDTDMSANLWGQIFTAIQLKDLQP